MKSRALYLILAGLMLLACRHSDALADIKTCTYMTAVPSNSFHLFSGTGLNMSSLRDTFGYAGSGYDITAGGVFIGVRVNPRLELVGSLWVKDAIEGGELQGKYLFWNKERQYLSIAPGFVYSSGEKYENQQTDVLKIDKCVSGGIDLPLIYTYDTRRNLLINAYLAGGCQWIKYWGQRPIYDDDMGVYGPHYFDQPYKPYVMLRLGASMEAIYKPLSMIPVLGFTVYDNNGKAKTAYNLGLSVGASW
jgi:hypothetical protein